MRREILVLKEYLRAVFPSARGDDQAVTGPACRALRNSLPRIKEHHVEQPNHRHDWRDAVRAQILDPARPSAQRWSLPKIPRAPRWWPWSTLWRATAWCDEQGGSRVSHGRATATESLLEPTTLIGDIVADDGRWCS